LNPYRVHSFWVLRMLASMGRAVLLDTRSPTIGSQKSTFATPFAHALQGGAAETPASDN
jgi:hypothetical protein